MIRTFALKNPTYKDSFPLKVDWKTIKLTYLGKERTLNLRKILAIYGKKSLMTILQMMMVSTQNSSIDLSICSKKESHTNWEAQYGQWFLKISLELHGNFTCNFYKDVKKAGSKKPSGPRFERISIGLLAEKVSKSKIKINLLIKFSKFWNCLICTGLM